MEPDEPKSRRNSALSAVLTEDLSLLGLEELAERITLLNQEISRVEATIASKQASKSDAEAVFRKP